jgi:hypothetical protein
VALDAAELAALFEPESGYGAAPAMIDRALSDWRAAQSRGSPT